MTVLVAGASGFVGRRLCPTLVEAGVAVRAMTRRPDRYRGAGTPVRADAADAASVRAALEGCEAAYYLVHSLASADFETKDAAAARVFGRAAAEAGVTRIVYLGGLGADGDVLSAHLRSRRQVEALLGEAGVPATTVRAGIIVGHGGISWEITRQLVEHLPAMITPRWVRTRTQPIAAADVIRYLVGVLQVPEAAGRVFEIGGPEVLAYVDMLRRVAALEGRRTPIVPVPLLSPSLSSLWLALVTDVDVRTGRSLIDSMINEVVVRDDSIRELGVGEHTYRRPVITPVVTGVAAFGAFYAAALVVRRIPLLDEAITSVLSYATRGTGPLVLTTALANAVAEEVFFRGALYAALAERRAVPVSTAVYVTATAATRNPALVLASAVMGTLFAAQRRASGGVQAPMLTHLTWSALMLRYLPPLFREPRPARAGSTG